MIHIDLFSGIGGFALAVDEVWPGIEHIFCEIDPFCQAVLKKHWKGAKLYGDIRTLTYSDRNRLQVSGAELEAGGDRQFSEATANAHRSGNRISTSQTNQNRQEIDKGRQEQSQSKLGRQGCYILTAGCPCQPASQAGKRRGTKDDRWLWGEAFRIIRETQPRFVILENVRGILTLESGLVFKSLLAEMEGCGYETRAYIIPAVAVNAPHRRDRVWFVAKNSRGGGLHGQEVCNEQQGRSEAIRTSESVECRSQGLEKRVNSNAPDTEPKRLLDRDAGTVRRPTQDKECERQTGGRFTAEQWDKNWLEVAKCFCGMDDELSAWMDESFNIIINEEDYSADKKDRAEGVRILRKAIQQTDEQGERIRGIFKVSETEVLLSFLRHIEETSIGQGVEVESEQGEEACRMRELWQDIRFASPSYRPEISQQLAKELTDLVPELPYKTAQCFAEIWNYCQNSFSSMISQAVELDGLKFSKARHRVERLKALGNAIVPQVAIEIMKAIKYATPKE